MSWNYELKVENFSLPVFLPLIPVLTILIPPSKDCTSFQSAQAGVE